MLKRFALALLVFPLTSGCAVNRATATVTPGADPGTARTFFVVQPSADSSVRSSTLSTKSDCRDEPKRGPNRSAAL